MVSIISCDCKERIGIKINSWKQFQETKTFFEVQVKKGIFSDIPVEKPYYVGYTINRKEKKWYADKWYKCLECGVLWEFIYPDFPAQGSVRKISVNDYNER